MKRQELALNKHMGPEHATREKISSLVNSCKKIYIELGYKRSKSVVKRVLGKSSFLTFPHEKTTFQWSKLVSEATFPTN